MPENTLPAFARALELGVTTLELDCGITRDGVVVVSHDSALNPDITRDAQGRWLERASPAIRRLTYEELSRYDVGRIKPGSEYARRFPKQRALDHTPIPRLADLFSRVRQSGNDRVRFNIETKISPLRPDDTAAPDAFVRELLEVVMRANFEGRVTVQSFDWRTLELVQRDAPRIATAYLTAQESSMDNIRARTGASPWTAPHHVSRYGGSIPRMIKAAGGATWSPSYGELTRDALGEAQSLGLKVVTWTVNGEADMRRMIEWGVDGIISDYPDVLLKIAGRAAPA